PVIPIAPSSNSARVFSSSTQAAQGHGVSLSPSLSPILRSRWITVTPASSTSPRSCLTRGCSGPRQLVVLTAAARFLFSPDAAAPEPPSRSTSTRDAETQRRASVDYVGGLQARFPRGWLRATAGQE